jgi:hypothetical protein
MWISLSTYLYFHWVVSTLSTCQYHFRLYFIFLHNPRNAESGWVKWWITSFHISMIPSCSSSRVLSNSSHTSSLKCLCWFWISLYYPHFFLIYYFALPCFFSIFSSFHIYIFFSCTLYLNLMVDCLIYGFREKVIMHIGLIYS